MQPLAPRILLLAAAVTGVCGQQFDVAAVKPNTANDNRFEFRNLPGGSFNATGVTLKMLILSAYELRNFQVSGGPAWIDTDRWDIRAKVEGIEGRLPNDRFHQMLRALIEDRFQLKLHRETRELPVYALLAGKNGSKLTPTTEGPQGLRTGRGSLSFQKGSMPALATQLSMRLGRMVIDKTNLTGEYEFKLEWTPESNESGPEAYGLPPVLDAPAAGDTNGPSIFTEVREQLGLRLESQRGPVEVMVIDRVEKAAGN